ncbi:MAG: mercuric transporter MerT family protein, partial [Gemmatimonadales bacterium]|nr:mercuric transporter MerT family protein [Gemmatimonadales bacterium]
MIRRPFAAAGGAVAAALGSALCCAGPLVAVALGLSGAGLARTFEPLRPYFVGATALALGVGHWSLRKEERNACEPGRPCADPRTRRVMRWTVWLATIFAAVFATFPYWSRFV